MQACTPGEPVGTPGLLCVLVHANVYQTVYLPPSGGPILSSPAKKEPGKKDAAKGGGGPPPLDLTPCLPHRYYSRTLYRLPGRFARASVPCKPVRKPLAASLSLTECGGDLAATVVDGFCVVSVGTKGPGALGFPFKGSWQRGTR